MKQWFEPILIPLAAPLHCGQGTAYVCFGGISRVCILFHYLRLFISSGGAGGQSLPLVPSFSPLPGLLGLDYLLKVTPWFLILPAVLQYFFGSPLHICCQR